MGSRNQLRLVIFGDGHTLSFSLFTPLHSDSALWGIQAKIHNLRQITFLNLIIFKLGMM